jgi:hypothetical protein
MGRRALHFEPPSRAAPLTAVNEASTVGTDWERVDRVEG